MGRYNAEIVMFSFITAQAIIRMRTIFGSFLLLAVVLYFVMLFVNKHTLVDNA